MTKTNRFEEDFSVDYYPSGKVEKMTTRVDYERDGIHVEFYESGAVKLVRNMANGKYHGLSYEYKPDGSLKRTVKWENDHLVNERSSERMIVSFR